MSVENVRRTCEEQERDLVLQEMGEQGYTLVAVTDDGWNTPRKVGYHYWSLYFTKITEEMG
jgi:hypothetical protein